jgi:hypothetical protein
MEECTEDGAGNPELTPRTISLPLLLQNGYKKHLVKVTRSFRLISARVGKRGLDYYS